jgi:hypothetical protein
MSYEKMENGIIISLPSRSAWFISLPLSFRLILSFSDLLQLSQVQVPLAEGNRLSIISLRVVL